MSEPATELSPEKLFDRKWAQTILNRSLERLADEWNVAGKGGLFSELRRYVAEEPVPGTYAEISGRLGITQETIRQRRTHERGCPNVQAHIRPDNSLQHKSCRGGHERDQRVFAEKRLRSEHALVP